MESVDIYGFSAFIFSLIFISFAFKKPALFFGVVFLYLALMWQSKEIQKTIRENTPVEKVRKI
jgi:hypothetical protein